MRRAHKRPPITQIELDCINRIVNRALFLLPDRQAEHIQMDLIATILGGCKLRLEELERADDFNFAHDIVGIERHLDRTTFMLTNCFTPRFAVQH
jgi:hypothetical protein